MTQQDLDGLLARAAAQARAAGIPVSPYICPQVRLNRRARTRFGCCVRRDGRYTIELSAQLAREGSEQAVMQVLCHEVLHTCFGCANHGPRWQSYARRMNAAYGYAIRRTDDYDALGLVDDRPVRYWVVCAKCGRRIPRMKRSPLVDCPGRYRCSCGGALRVEPVAGAQAIGYEKGDERT